MYEIKKKLEELNEEVKRIVNFLDLPAMQKEMTELEKDAENPNFWDDPAKAQSKSKKMAGLKDTIEKWNILTQNTKELLDLCGMIDAEKTPDEAEELRQQTHKLDEQISKESIIVFFSGSHDKKDAILSFHVGTGGVDAQDWAEMLFRMYLRFAEKKNWSVEIYDKSMGEEAGLKSATVKISGQFAYGFLKNEMGVHRLVRLSPFNAKHTRETSFALVEVLPDLGDDHENIKIDEKDLKIDVFRASGHGGQSVNTTDSAVRIVHLPTNTVVQCQNERSQHQNKEQAMKVLKAKLLKIQEEQHSDDINKLRGGKLETSWGHQIRSYVLHPYKMVKDHRTGYETSNAEGVLDGDLDEIIETNLEKIK